MQDTIINYKNEPLQTMTQKKKKKYDPKKWNVVRKKKKKKKKKRNGPTNYYKNNVTWKLLKITVVNKERKCVCTLFYNFSYNYFALYDKILTNIHIRNELKQDPKNANWIGCIHTKIHENMLHNTSIHCEKNIRNGKCHIQLDRNSTKRTYS